MLTKKCQRHHSFLQPPPKFIDSSTSGVFSSDSITTATTMTSSGYSTGGSSLLTTIIPSSKNSSALSLPRNQQKIKSKDKQRKTSTHGFSNFVSKLKSFITSPKTKFLNSTTSSKKSSSANMILQCSTSYHPSSVNNTISLPFTYYHQSNKQSAHKESYVTKSTNFEKISAWLDHTEILTQKDNDLLFIDECQQDSRPSSPVQIDYQIFMKKASSTSRTPKRSTSMVATMARPVIERKQYENTVSPTYSFSSSILTRGMTDTLTPQTIYQQPRPNPLEESSHSLLPKSNRRRVIDFSRRRTVGGINEQTNNNNNKENLPINPRQQIYRFSPTTSTNTVAKKYFFHPNPPVKNEDILMNSYGLTILQQQQRQSIKKPQIPDISSIRMPTKSVDRRPSIPLKQPDYTSDLLDDILCDREVESYFYPTRRQTPPALPPHIYMNLGTSSHHYHPSSAYVHSTLC